MKDMLVDTHAHLDMISSDFDKVSSVMERARSEGVGAVISVGIDLESSNAALAFAKRFDDVFASVGIHPNDADQFSQDALAHLSDLATHKKVLAWGEIGLDFYRKHTSRQVQMQAFEAQLDTASAKGLPVIIHARDALDECIEIIASFLRSKHLTGVFHCFSGDIESAKKVLDLGFYLSFTGVITFPKAESVRKVVGYTPLDKILLETDSPFLSPVPYRGKANEPSRVRYVAETVAVVKEIDLSEVALCTTRNAKDLFALPLP